MTTTTTTTTTTLIEPYEEENDPNFERRLDEVTTGLDRYVRKHLLEKISKANSITIIEYIEALKYESNPKDGTRQSIIMVLKQLSEYHKNTKSFREMTRDDILAFLNRLRKPEEDDPLHQWIGTYATNVSNIKRFYKWLFYPLVEPKKRPNPDAIQNVHKLDRKEKTIYKDTDLWLDSDCNKIFFRYVPFIRDKAFHAMMLDTSCRPKELMSAKIKDLEFQDTGFNQKIAYLWVTGKSGRRIKKVLVKSLPYLRDWLNHGNHPMAENPNAYIFCGTGSRNKGRKLGRLTFSHRYLLYKKELFPNLLKSPDVPDEDKNIIREKLLTKPIRPYILRHTALTEKAQLIGEYELRLHADWTMTSNMPQRYLHFGGNESVAALLKAQGISPTTDGENSEIGKITKEALRPTLICSHCKEHNKPEAKFCSNPACGMVLTFEAHTETIGEAESTKKEVERLNEKLKSYEKRNLKTFMNILRYLSSSSGAGKTDKKFIFEGALPELEEWDKIDTEEAV